MEVLIPDYLGDPVALETTLVAGPEVLNHNLETVPRLYGALRTQASYRRSLQVLRRSRQFAEAFAPQMKIKTGLMLGVGETRDEVVEVLRDALENGVQIVTIGQYLQPTDKHHPVRRYVEPAEFAELADIGRDLGLQWVESGPLVRSSYHAREQSEGLARGGSDDLPGRVADA